MNLSDASHSQTQHEHDLPGDFSGRWILCDRARVEMTENSVIIAGGFFRHGEAHGDGELRFILRAPEGAAEAQSWVGFRCRDRHSRYTVALRGGNNNHLHLARLAPEGGARFLGIAPLDFAPVVGKWYELRVVLDGLRIQVYLDGDEHPRLDVVDDDKGWTCGSAVLGGGYLPTEITRFSITPGVKARAFASHKTPNKVTPGFRHADYHPLTVGSLHPVREEISLDGYWLFHPVKPGSSLEEAREVSCDETNWHTIDVPNLWTPFLSWLHGETTFHKLEGVSSSKGINDAVWLEEMARVEGYGFDWNATQEAWYRHHLVLPEDITGRRFELRFGAVAKSCAVWVNGRFAGAHVGMFGEVLIDASAHLRPGENVIAVQVLRNPENLSVKDDRIVGIAESVEVTVDMTSSLPKDIICHDPAGIWQPVTLLVTRDIKVSDVFVLPSLDTAHIAVSLDVPEESASALLSVRYAVRHLETGDILIMDDSVAKANAAELAHLEFDLPAVSPLHWHPDAPHLYELEIQLYRNGEILDHHTTIFGFRTFETRGNRFYLNGQPYWLRGANHFPHGLRPNDREVARNFIALAREGNIRTTRFHVAPLTKAWAEEADRQGLLISFEGIWPWLMLNGAPPSPALLDAWHDDFASLVRKYRNHPSITLWTVNNEMKFYLFDKADKAMLQRKWAVVTRMINTVRQLDPSRPIVADSGYVRRQYQEGYDTVVKPGGFDDGDVDDVHQYYSWYHPSYTTACNGEFADGIASPDRPFISQELSSGYARNDDGLPVRFYLYKHGTPIALIGDLAYEHNDPSHFLDRLAFTTKETIEAIRRTNRDQVAGALNFSYLTWFKDVHTPSPTPWEPYHALKLALQPVLASVELAGLHFFCGDTIRRTVVLVNDASDASAIEAGTLIWEIVDKSGRVLSTGRQATPRVDYYSNARIPVEFVMPPTVDGRCESELCLRLLSGGRTITENRYDILIATRQWAAVPLTGRKAGADQATWTAQRTPVISPAATPYLIVRGEDAGVAQNLSALRSYVEKGGRLLFLNAGELLPIMLPGIVKSYRKVRGEIVHAFLPESPVFDGIESRDLAWFYSDGSTPALACEGVFRVDRDHPKTTILAQFCDYHNYLNNPEDIMEYTGTPLWECQLGSGLIVSSEMNPAAVSHDPVAARLQSNLIAYVANSGMTELRSAAKADPATA